MTSKHENIIGVNYWVNSTGCSGEFHIVFEQFEDLKNLQIYWRAEKVNKFKLKRIFVKSFDKSHHICALHIFGYFFVAQY